MFSIVVPLFNKASTIERTLSSILTQTYKEFEVLIINDGSTDFGANIIENFTKDHRIRVINQENQGVSVARNNGVEYAKYDYVAFLDGDDEWKPCFLETVKNAIYTFPEAGIFATATWHSNYITGESDVYIPTKYKGKIQIASFFKDTKIVPHISAVVINKKFIAQVDEQGNCFPKGLKYGEDLAFMYRIALVSQYVYIGLPLSVRNNNVVGQICEMTSKDHFRNRRSMTISELEKQLFPVSMVYNLCYSKWAEKSIKSNNFLEFFKFRMRGIILGCLKAGDYRSIDVILDNLDSKLLEKTLYTENWAFRQGYLRHISILYIYFTFFISKLKGLF